MPLTSNTTAFDLENHMTEWVEKSYHWEVCMRGDRTAYLCQSHSSIALLSWCIARQMHSLIGARSGGGSEMHVKASSFVGVVKLRNEYDPRSHKKLNLTGVCGSIVGFK